MMKTTCKTHLLARGATMPFAFALASGAAAQTLPAPADSPAAIAITDSNDIVVTAQRREESLQDVPVALSAFNANTLANSGITSTKDLTQITPGLNFTQSSFAPQPTIRGVGTRGVGAGDESVVPIFIDGVYQPFIFNAISDLLGVERIEVLRGPQSALYGRNATGGAINIVTRDPQADPTAELGFRYGRFAERDLTGYLSGGTDTIATALAVRWHKDHGYSRDIVTGQRMARLDSISIRSKTKWQPTDRISFVLSGSYANRFDNTATTIRPINADTQARQLNPAVLTVGDHYKIAHTFADYLRIKNSNVALTGTLELGPFDVHAISSYTYGRDYGNSDTDATPDPFSVLEFTQRSKSVYNELYLTSNGDGPISYTVGGVYFHDVSRSDPAISEATTLTAGPTRGTLTRVSVFSRVTTDSYAGYAQADWKFAKDWSVILGGRYTDEKKSYIARSITLNTRTGVSTPFTAVPASVSYSEFTPTGTITWQPVPEVNLYAKAGKAFKSGLFNTSGTNMIPVRPEKITQYEFGTKLEPASNLRLNLSAYLSRQSDVQLNARDPVTGQTFLQNAAKTKIYGIESELYWRPVQRLNLRSTFSLLHGEYTNFPNASVTIPQTTVAPVPATACVPGTGALVGGNRSLICDVSGNDVIRTPFLTVTFGGDYTVPLAGGDLTFSGNFLYAGHSYWDPLNRLREPSYTIVNMLLNWTSPDKNYQIGIGGDNVFNDYRHLSVVTSAGTDNESDARPASWYVQLKAKF